MHVGKLAKQLAYLPNNTLNANTQTNLKENFSVVVINDIIVVKSKKEETEELEEENMRKESCKDIQQTLPQKKAYPGRNALIYLGFKF